jgi:hypothetical protein
MVETNFCMTQDLSHLTLVRYRIGRKYNTMTCPFKNRVAFYTYNTVAFILKQRTINIIKTNRSAVSRSDWFGLADSIGLHIRDTKLIFNIRNVSADKMMSTTKL